LYIDTADAEQLYLSCISISGAQDEPQSKSTKPSSRFEALSELFEVLNKSVLLGDINSLQSLATDFPGIVPQVRRLDQLSLKRV
jgi:hypothetical protein